MEKEKRPSILYSCYYNVNREGEQFVPDHVLSYQVAGTLAINNGEQVHTIREGDFRFSRKNQLAKFIKTPSANAEFKSISILFEQQTLKDISLEYDLQIKKRVHESIISLSPHPLLQNYMDSLMPYLELPRADNTALFAVKVKEAVLILLKTNPELKDVLFDFTEPGKIDLEEFMNKNYHFNVALKRFAYLTGRSLSTFKRDFEKIFGTTPSRWLQKKRLQEAHYLIKQKGAAPSDVYLDVGFEDLSHFSFAFKKMYGVAPSKI